MQDGVSTGEYRVTLVAVGTETGTVHFYGADSSVLSCLAGFDARVVVDDSDPLIGSYRSEVLAVARPLVVAWSSDTETTIPTVGLEPAGESSPPAVAGATETNSAPTVIDAAELVDELEPHATRDALPGVQRQPV